MSNYSPETWVQQVRSIIAAVPEPWPCALPEPLAALFDELPYEICLLDATGVITFTNKPWRAFAIANGGPPDKTDAGVSYLDACDQTDEGRAFGDKLRNVCSGLFSEAVFLEYPCHNSNISRWYVASACRFETPVTPIIVVVHHCIEQANGSGGCCGAPASTSTPYVSLPACLRACLVLGAIRIGRLTLVCVCVYVRLVILVVIALLQ